jgi:hypothetical protein
VARSDYRGCAVCDGKTFYDANVPMSGEWDDDPKRFSETNGELLPQGCGDVVALCRGCIETHRIEVVKVPRG